jgi:hypothetical protein
MMMTKTTMRLVRSVLSVMMFIIMWRWF